MTDEMIEINKQEVSTQATVGASWEELDREAEERLYKDKQQVQEQGKEEKQPLPKEPITKKQTEQAGAPTVPKAPPPPQTPQEPVVMDLNYEENIISDFYGNTFDILAKRYGDLWKLDEAEKKMLASPTKKILEKNQIKMTPEVALISSALIIVAPRFVMTSMEQNEKKKKKQEELAKKIKPTPQQKPEIKPEIKPEKKEPEQKIPPLESDIVSANARIITNKEETVKQNPKPTASHEVLGGVLDTVKQEVKPL